MRVCILLTKYLFPKNIAYIKGFSIEHPQRILCIKLMWGNLTTKKKI